MKKGRQDIGVWGNGDGSRLAEIDFWANGVIGWRGEEVIIRGKILVEGAREGEVGQASSAGEAEGFERDGDGRVGNSVKAWFGKFVLRNLFGKRDSMCSKRAIITLVHV